MTGKFLILGSGVTGSAVAEFLMSRGVEFRVSSLSSIPPELKGRLKEASIPFEEGSHSEEWFSWADWIVLSPSIRKDRLPKSVQERCISELDLAQTFFQGKIIAITGTNGKTTTVSMLSHVLVSLGYNAIACGNIGLPFISVLDRGVEVAVVEVSSFQLFNSSSFRPDVFAVLNITPDHLNWHRDIEEYAKAKLSPIKRMDNPNKVFLNRQSELIVRYYSGKANWFFGGQNENEACVLAICQALGLSEEEVRPALSNFRPPRHRMSFVGEGKGLRFINDSKATNPDSTSWALSRLREKLGQGKIVLLCGGRGKGLGYNDILKYKDVLRAVVGFGEEGPKIVSELADVPGWVEPDLEQAFLKAVDVAIKGDTILLSPMCASFDQYENYEKRGAHFEELVLSYLQS